MKFVEPPLAPCRNVLLYGPPKTGKTAGACTAPGPVALLNADLPNATWFAHSRSPKGHLQEILYEGFATLKELGVAANKRELDKVIPGCKTIVVDPVNELYMALLREASNDAVSPSLPKYQQVGVHVERFCRALCRNPDVNVVLVCHDLPVKDEAAGEVERLPSTGTTNPALGRKLEGMVDIVGFTGVLVQEDEEPKYVAQTIVHRGRRGGDRFNALGDYAEMNLTEWFKLGPQDEAPAMEEPDESSQEEQKEAA